jgi:hypothetical protein
MPTDEDLVAEVKRSGFPLQLTVEQFVKAQAQAVSNCEVRSLPAPQLERDRIHRPRVLSQLSGVAPLVIECNRVQETEWIFLKNARRDSTPVTRGYVSRNQPVRRVLGWHDLDVISPLAPRG